jgi:hypothetical protein
VWCLDQNADENSLTDPESQLCRSHMNEYDGVSEDGYQAMLAGERYDRS